MRHLSILVVFLTLLNHLGLAQMSQRKSEAGRSEIKAGDFSSAIDYSRPSKKDRLIFGTEEQKALVPFGKKWRTGANEATEITITKPITIDGNQLEAGSYSIYTIPNESSWIIAFNSRTSYWGKSILGSPFKEKKDLFRITTTPQSIESTVEKFTISMDQTSDDTIEVTMTWDQTAVSFEMKI